MKDKLTRALGRAQTSFGEFTLGQKLVTVIGSLALLIGGFMVFQWASAPSYAPLFSNLSGKDASAIVDELDASGTPYELTDGGGTVLVPQASVPDLRIKMAADGLPSSASEGGTSPLELPMGASQDQTDNALRLQTQDALREAIESLAPVNTAVVNLAMPKKEVFSESQDPVTASVLVDTKAGQTLSPDNVAAIVHLVSSAVPGLDPKEVTVTDSTGALLSDGGDGTASAATGRAQQEQALAKQYTDKVQAVLDRVVGPGNAIAVVTPTLDFDATTERERTYSKSDAPPLSQSTSTEKYSGNPDGTGDGNGVVGVDGQTEDPSGTGVDTTTDGTGTTGSTGSGEGAYERGSETKDNAVNVKETERTSAPGTLAKLGVSVMMNQKETAGIDPQAIAGPVKAALAFDAQRGDTFDIEQVPFSTAAADAQAAALAEAKAADAAAARNELIRNGALGGLVALLVGLAFWRSRKRDKARAQATTYVVEQLRADNERRELTAAEAEAALATQQIPALAALQRNESDELQEELAALVERQPEDVAALLRGWLVEKP